jgi:16S rRNA (guanine527-N7)-methyltransferase
VLNCAAVAELVPHAAVPHAAVSQSLLSPADARHPASSHPAAGDPAAGDPAARCATTLVDLGSGAGLPGIVLALLLPDVEVILLERMERRAAFLQECVRVLGLPNTLVRCGRAEDLAGQIAADVVTARAVAPMERLAGLALGLTRPGGLVLAIKGAGAEDEVAQAGPELRRLGAEDVTVLRVGGGKVNRAATVVRLVAGGH